MWKVRDEDGILIHGKFVEGTTIKEDDGYDRGGSNSMTTSPVRGFPCRSTLALETRFTRSQRSLLSDASTDGCTGHSSLSRESVIAEKLHPMVELDIYQQ